MRGNFMSDVKNAQARPGVEPVWDENQAAWDEARPRGTSGGLRGISGADWLIYGAVAAVALGIGVVNALSKAQDVAWHGGGYDAGTPLLWEMTSIAVIILLAPMLFVSVRRMRHATGRRASGSNPATSFGSARPGITSNTASQTAPITSSGQPWRPRKRD